MRQAWSPCPHGGQQVSEEQDCPPITPWGPGTSGVSRSELACPAASTLEVEGLRSHLSIPSLLVNCATLICIILSAGYIIMNKTYELQGGYNFEVMESTKN